MLDKEIEKSIEELQALIKHYNPLNIIGGAIIYHNFQSTALYSDFQMGRHPVAPEYLALLCLKAPYSLSMGEFTRMNEMIADFWKMNELAFTILHQSLTLHFQKIRTENEKATHPELEEMARLASSEELFVRNATYEDHHWELLQDLYEPYDDYFSPAFGFSINQAIDICLAIYNHVSEAIEEFRKDFHQSWTDKYQEIVAYKKKGTRPKNFYPPEHLQQFKQMSEDEIKANFMRFAFSYQLSGIGQKLSFDANTIAQRCELPEKTVKKFFDQFSLGFGEISVDFSKPEILHPLKHKPLIRHNNSYFCTSLSLLDYALDLQFEEALLNDASKAAKYKEIRHDYTLQKGLHYIQSVLKGAQVYQNLRFPGGEMDGLVLYDNNAIFVESKGNKIGAKAKLGYTLKIKDHIKEIIKKAHEQATKASTFVMNTPAAEFVDKKGRKVTIPNSHIKHIYFITLTIDPIHFISANLRLENSLGLFTNNIFPWIVSLYDLRVVCEHMEGPSYFLHYLFRRREFLKATDFIIQDELDLLGHYLTHNLRFEGDTGAKILKARKLYLPSFLDEFNNYYLSQAGMLKKHITKRKHFTIEPVKTLVKEIEATLIKGKTDVSIQILELGSEAKKDLIRIIRQTKKRYKKDGLNHDARIAAGEEKDALMISYWDAPDTPFYNKLFLEFTLHIHKEYGFRHYIAILDSGKEDYKIQDVFSYSKSKTY